MPQFTWDTAYEVGDSEIDEQHRRLFDLANELLGADTKASVTAAAIQLYQYVRVHFKHEEDLMRRIGFPDYRQHVQMHSQMVDRLNALSADIADGCWRSQDLRAFMNEWLLIHIAEQDTRLADYVAAAAASSAPH
ncbi:Bacteriohemerythrin [Rubrivivax sp. A210]|uniref:bacteriohemerythrin n=1 Tax=Rubrivivax sp. A210 TaxID=2772301 RepID=UPI0019198B53|nr:bacteriohemerythrin [Rubrivivax sp. A210]CAD5366424.1 Bacteriohemerythrin [Rubrivivax sp. A210]